MDAEEVLRRLKKAKAPHRTLDIMIGLLVGYKRSFDHPPEGSDKEATPIFTDRSGERAKIPDYTRNIDEALALSVAIVPNIPAAFSWDGELYKAQFWNAPVAEAPDLALAICTAIFEAYAMRMR